MMPEYLCGSHLVSGWSILGWGISVVRVNPNLNPQRTQISTPLQVNGFQKTFEKSLKKTGKTK